MLKIKLGDVKYNAQRSAFEARVDIERGGTTFRYPCEVAGPMNMDIQRVKSGLTRHALRQSDSPALVSVI